MVVVDGNDDEAMPRLDFLSQYFEGVCYCCVELPLPLPFYYLKTVDVVIDLFNT